MGNPLLSLNLRPWRRASGLRRRRVEIPTDLPSTDAVFLVLRRMRQPLIALLLVFVLPKRTGGPGAPSPRRALPEGEVAQATA